MSLNRAKEFLRSYVKGGTWHCNERIGTLSALALKAHVRRTVMVEALRWAQQQNLVTVIARKGIFAGSVFQPDTTTTTEKWHTIRRQIENDIILGAYRKTGMLPNLTQLSQRYGAHRLTIKKAITTLIKDNVIVTDRNGFRIRSTVPNKSSATILFITRGDRYGKVLHFSTRVADFIYGLVNETNHVHLRLQKVTLEMSANPATLGPLLKQWYENHTVIGTIIWKDCFPQALFAELERQACRYRLPVAIIDELGDYHQLTHVKQTSRNTVLKKCFQIAGYKAGAQIARYLLECGHTSIAFLTYTTSAGWITKRLQGLRDTFANAGFPDAVSIFPFDIALEESQIAHHPLHRFLELTQQSILQPLKEQSNLFTQKWQLEEARYNLLGSLKTQVNNENFRPVLKKILQRKDISTIVAINDELAICAMNAFAGNQKNAVDIIGFDDTALAQMLGMTSYNFNFADLAHTALKYILNPRHDCWGKADTMECEGVIMERESSGTRRT